MQVSWDKLMIRSLLWLSLEILLGAMGADTLADYSEFLIEAKKGALRQNIVCSVVV